MARETQKEMEVYDFEIARVFNMMGTQGPNMGTCPVLDKLAELLTNLEDLREAVDPKTLPGCCNLANSSAKIMVKVPNWARMSSRFGQGIHTLGPAILKTDNAVRFSQWSHSGFGRKTGE